MNKTLIKLLFFVLNCSIMKTTTPRMRSHWRIFSEKADHWSSGLEDEADDSPDETFFQESGGQFQLRWQLIWDLLSESWQSLRLRSASYCQDYGCYRIFSEWESLLSHSREYQSVPVSQLFFLWLFHSLLDLYSHLQQLSGLLEWTYAVLQYHSVPRAFLIVLEYLNLWTLVPLCTVYWS